MKQHISFLSQMCVQRDPQQSGVVAGREPQRGRVPQAAQATRGLCSAHPCLLLLPPVQARQGGQAGWGGRRWSLLPAALALVGKTDGGPGMPSRAGGPKGPKGAEYREDAQGTDINSLSGSGEGFLDELSLEEGLWGL